MPAVEIVICTFNRAQALDACLATLARQTAPDGVWSVLVVDNASTDGTQAVVERHLASGVLPGLRCVREERPGLTAARQRGAAEARAPYVAFVDDDCHIAPDWISQALSALERHPGAAALGGRVEPTWRPDIPPVLRRHGWIFAQQPHERDDNEGAVESLVGTGLVLDRKALVDSGWLNDPLLEDRIGRGATSGGDVEICLRLRVRGGALFFIPGMRLEHRIDTGRQTLPRMLELAAGLGTGSALVTLLQTDLPAGKCLDAAARENRKRRRMLLAGLLRRHFGWTDWRIYDAFERGRRAGLMRLRSDDALRTRLAGRCLPAPPAASGRPQPS
jgi:glucosyl-dolichyl phosphate glucuronosyltransferase